MALWGLLRTKYSEYINIILLHYLNIAFIVYLVYRGTNKQSSFRGERYEESTAVVSLQTAPHPIINIINTSHQKLPLAPHPKPAIHVYPV